MTTAPQESNYLSETDNTELDKLVTTLELSDGVTIIFAIAPDSSPQHPAVEQFKILLSDCDENFQIQNFFYSDNSLYNFLYSLDHQANIQQEASRRLIMAFGIDQLPLPRLVREMKQLNLGRESIYSRNIVLIFWLSKPEFLEEFSNRAPDFWDWRNKVVTFETRPVLNPLLYSYLERLIAENSYLKISGVMQVQRQVDIFLDQIYVSLQAVRRQEIVETEQYETINYTQIVTIGSSSSHDLDEPCYYDEPVFLESSFCTTTKTITQKVDSSQAVRQNNFSVILGAPGAGKTTLLRYLALHFAIAKRDSQEIVTGGEEQELGKTLLPVFFRIADYAERLDKQPNLSLLDYLRQYHAEAEVIARILETMQQGQCLMLLDGLDEVFDQESRRLIVERINQFVDAFSGNKFVITSRIAGYRDVQLSSRFAEFTIEDMGSEEVEKFLYRWCRAVEKAQQPEATEEQWQKAGDNQTREILEAIQDNEGVKRLTANPLLLTILALIHRNGARLPNRRVELYALAVKTLIEDWQLSKKLPDAPTVVLKESEVVRLLAPLAYWMHEEKPSGLVTQAEVEEQLAEKLAELNDIEKDTESVRQAVEEFLRKVRETTGLFVERAPGVYGFMHLTFEEYFVARYIADHDQSDILSIINKHFYEPRWNEPILLALGYYGIHFNAQVDKLLKKLFSNLDTYDPTLKGGDIKVKNALSQDAILVWSNSQCESTSQLELKLKYLLFAGEVLTQVEINNSSIRKKNIQKIVITYLCLNINLINFKDDTTKQLLKILRRIESFIQKGEVVALLQQAANDSKLSEENRIKAQLAILYVLCGKADMQLVNYVTNIVNNLNPTLFCGIRDLVTELGEEMSSALENCHYLSLEQNIQNSLFFLISMTYLRKDNYDKAVTYFEEIKQTSNSKLKPYLDWALATVYQEKEEFNQAYNYYQECFHQLTLYIELSAFKPLWVSLGLCHCLHGKYQQSIKCIEQALAIDKEFGNLEYEANTLWKIGKAYKEWGKYEQAISYYQQSLDILDQLDKKQGVANLWGMMSESYRDWGKYEQAIEYRQNYLQTYQYWENNSNVAYAYYELGRIYQAWGKYEQAISYYQQSRNLYEQLDREQGVANLWSWISGCYRDWGKYEQAIQSRQNYLQTYQRLDNQPNVASAYCQLGRIYQEWGRYEQAISYYQQSRNLYEQLGREQSVANQWGWISDCYRDWGRYEQAIQSRQNYLQTYQRLDNQLNVAIAYWQLGRIYQAWGKYEQAISYYQQSRDLYKQLDREQDTANQWSWISECYRNWGKYEQALESLENYLQMCQRLDNQPNVASAYYHFGRIYQAWGKYEQAVSYYQQSRNLYEQLGREQNVANQWGWISECYRDWGKYEQAMESRQNYLQTYQRLDNQPNVASAYYQFGRINQAWGKYEQALSYYQQSRNLYKQLGREQNLANQLSWLASCYQDLKDYNKAINYYQQSCDLHSSLGNNKSVAIRCRRLAYTQGLLARNTENTTQASDLLAQAEQNIYQAMQINTTGAYTKNLAYDHIALSLLMSERLRLLPLLPKEEPSLQEQIAQFEENYNIGLSYFDELEQIVDKADEVLDIARAYLEVGALENLDKAEQLAQESLNVFQEYNRRKLEAFTYKLLGEIYLKRRERNHYNAEAIATQFLTESLQIYRALDLQEKATEVEKLLYTSGK